MNSCEITRRGVSSADHPFLLQLYAATREAELSHVPWADQQKVAFVEMQFQAQLAGYLNAYPQAQHQIIVVDGAPVGRIYWSFERDRIHILDITVAPAQRNAGIGSCVLREILGNADRTARKVTIYVESFNPSCGLFARLGFLVAGQDGIQLLLERPPLHGVSQPA